MGVSRSLAEFQRKIAQLPNIADSVAKKAVVANARFAKQNALDEAKRVAPSGVLRNVGRRGSRLGASYKIASDGMSASVTPTGAWGLVEFDTKHVPYGVASRKNRGSRASRSAAVVAGQLKKPRGAILTPQGPRAYAVIRKKRRAKQPWKKAFDKTAAGIGGTLGKFAEDEGRKVFG